MAEPPSQSDPYNTFLHAYQQGSIPETFAHLLHEPSAVITELIQSRHDPSHPSHFVWEQAEQLPRFREYRLQKLADEVGIPVTTTGPDTAIIADPPVTGNGNVTHDTKATEKACELLNEDENAKAVYEPSQHGILVWWKAEVCWPEDELAPRLRIPTIMATMSDPNDAMTAFAFLDRSEKPEEWAKGCKGHSEEELQAFTELMQNRLNRTHQAYNFWKTHRTTNALPSCGAPMPGKRDRNTRY
ncbi:uncharacterized protein BDZ99DRAFT_517837 [Mytilinidion resinicola]|uniref:Uncharacterized protein n=1 Tax=Mytilinidion resinicola TaxID=574789 RepID=A0A6A6YXT2_9PEZI|nr:uncharacterized protein BDZ99DRAFT_517837 [Mytilinidion resinicola]KAF2813590.1 hypothetical protein BDZ99DRAFT_517837 [Mytilinidion resinicola]